jgi:predicted deacylase
VDVQGEQLGIFYPAVKRGMYVEAGMKLGKVTDFFGKTIAEPRTPVAGVILHVDALPTVKKGDNIANIGVVAAKAP